ncbi:Fungal-trans domain-containing protein [Mycena chlorophos]|uniref:Polynucleotide 5'-hydroxyl-kinase GRC3 n=1 Tax=Mycena chlorophos TaxID=658473 RepID=A0A8H6T029_MYCCL|nr:Fungal-trans domain-containing protein [Mycena chlorophos]
MLSAFAARKAAAQAAALTAPPSPSAPAVTPALSSKSAISTPNASKPTSKRKLSSQTPSSSRKRKKKREAEPKKTRYFEETAFDPSADVIVVDSEDEDEDGELLSDAGDELPAVQIPAASQRAYSPSAPVNDSSDDEDEVLDVSSSSQQPPSPPQNLSTFLPDPGKNLFHLLPDELFALGSSVDAGSLFALPPGTTLALVGAYSLRVLRGTVSIYGASLHASSKTHRVFAPRSAPIPVIEALHPVPAARIAIPPRLDPAFAGDTAVVVLYPLQTGAEGLGRACRVFEGVFTPPRLYNAYKSEPELLSTARLLLEPSKDLQPLFLPSTWTQALDTIIERTEPVILVKGPKNSGKSTFSRALVNRLLSRYRKVAFLECDIGQSEFTAGGMVALNLVDSPVFGPPFTHPALPTAAHYLGAITPRQLPAQYLSAIPALLETYRLEVATSMVDDDVTDGDELISDSIPLVVNTMGWVKGLGADLGQRIEEFVQPTDIIEFHLTASPPTPSSLATLHVLEPIAPSILTANYTAADHRAIACLSYFHADFTTPPAVTWDTSRPLCAQRPYEVDWSVALDKFVLCGPGSEDVVPTEITRVLNGAVVGLVEVEPGTLEDTESTSEVPYTQGGQLPSPSTSRCHGLAIIRSVSPTSSHLHLLTPLPVHLLSRCRVLVKGEMELPIWAMLDFTSTEEGEVAGTEKARVPYLQWTKSEGLGGERRHIRRTLMRKSQR